MVFLYRRLPDKIPEGMQPSIDELKSCKDKESCLRKAYDIMTSRYEGHMLFTISHFFELFPKKKANLWKRKGVMHCTNINYLLRILLVNSDHFSEEDILPKWVWIFHFSPHQALYIRIAKDKWVYVDVWGKHSGIEFGDYCRGFHLKTKSAHRQMN